MYRFSYKNLPISDEELTYSLSNVSDIYRQLGPYDMSALLEGQLIDKSKLREFYSTCVMVGGGIYTGQFLRSKPRIKDGVGYIIYPNGTLFEGVFSNDDTVKGRYIFRNG